MAAADEMKPAPNPGRRNTRLTIYDTLVHPICPIYYFHYIYLASVSFRNHIVTGFDLYSDATCRVIRLHLPPSSNRSKTSRPPCLADSRPEPRLPHERERDSASGRYGYQRQHGSAPLHPTAAGRQALQTGLGLAELSPPERIRPPREYPPTPASRPRLARNPCPLRLAAGIHPGSSRH